MADLGILSDIDQRITAHTFFINRNITRCKRFRRERKKTFKCCKRVVFSVVPQCVCSCTLPLTRFSTTKGDGTKSSIYFVKSRCSFSYPIPNFVEINIQMPNYRTPNLNYDIGNCPYHLRSTYASILLQPSISQRQLHKVL